MFEFSQPFFWYKLVFMAELLLAEGLLVYPLRRRSHFTLRAVAAVAGCMLAAFLLPVYFSWWYFTLLFFILYAVSLGAVALCFDEDFFVLLFCSILAYTVQHFAYNIYSYIAEASGLQASNVYEEQLGAASYNGLTAFMEVAVYAVVYWFVWAFVYRAVRLQEKLVIERRYLLPFVAVALFLDIVLTAIVVYGAQGELSIAIRTVIFLYSLIAGGFSIAMMLLMVGKGAAESELHLLERMWQQDKEMFAMRQSSVEVINLKAHDLKHQIRAFRRTGAIDEQELAEIETAVDIYDNQVDSGNKALDVVLSEFMLACRRSGIRFVHFVDGACLSMLGDGEVYSLFGNALSNAIEAAKDVEAEERVIRLSVKRELSYVVIHTENPFASSRTLDEDGLPKTTKGDIDRHGFGMRSMRAMAEKHGGTLACAVQGNVFHLNILLPINDT